MLLLTAITHCLLRTTPYSLIIDATHCYYSLLTAHYSYSYSLLLLTAITPYALVPLTAATPNSLHSYYSPCSLCLASADTNTRLLGAAYDTSAEAPNLLITETGTTFDVAKNQQGQPQTITFAGAVPYDH